MLGLLMIPPSRHSWLFYAFLCFANNNETSKSSPLVKPAYHPPPLQKTPNSQEAEITKLESDFKTFVEGLQKQYQERAETSEFVG